jgi:CRISPR system Cascade subunit CasC
MIQARYVQIHALTQYTAAMLNRDDSGLAKRLPYGGVMRTRVSSQCLKRHWRKNEGPFSLMNIAPDPYRTRELAEKAVMERVTEMLPGDEMTQEIHTAIAQALNVGLYGKDGNDRNKRQPLLFGQPETDWLAQRVAGILRENPGAEKAAEAVGAMFDEKSEQPNFSAFRQSIAMPAGVIGAMFGRMVTSDIDANIDSAISVAHAFTVHGEESEVDYFTAMGDLASAEPGAEHIGTTEINSGIYYVYVCIDVPTLVANTTGRPPNEWQNADRAIAAQAAGNLAGLIATVSPGAKKGSTAPFAYAEGMVVEIGERQPRSLSGAYRIPAKPEMAKAKKKLLAAMEECDQRYGEHETRRKMGFEPDSVAEETLDSLTQWIIEAVTRGEAS